MAEPIRKPSHRPPPPHPHAQSAQRKPRAVLPRRRQLPDEGTPETPALRPLQDLRRPALVSVPQPVVDPAPREPRADGERVLPPVATLGGRRIAEERSARSLLLTALALHLGVLVTGWFGQPSPELDSAELLLSGAVLLSGGAMLLLGGLRR